MFVFPVEMSHSYIADCSNSGGKGDDTLIIIVNSDGTLSVDPETLQKLLGKLENTLYQFIIVCLYKCVSFLSRLWCVRGKWH